MITFDIITIFPEVFGEIFGSSIIRRARDAQKVVIRVHDLRDFTTDKHRKVDDRPFGGGPGMVMTPQPFFDAVKKIKGRRKARVIYLCAGGKTFTQGTAKKLSRLKNIILLCGHYEGIDERVRLKLVDESISIGDYVLTGGEIPAMVLVDAVSRLIPGVVGKEASLTDESFENDLLEYPHYTRPAVYKGMKVPEVLLSGNHRTIEAWRRAQAIERTRRERPDLLSRVTHKNS